MQKTSVSRQAALEGLQVVSWTARADSWTIISIGGGIERLLGYPRAAWRAKGFWLSNVHAADAPGLQECLTQALTNTRQPAVTCEYRITDAAGELHWLRTSIASAVPGARTISGAHLDITDEYRALEALGIASERSQFALRVAGVSIWEREADENDGISPTIAALAGVKPARHLDYDEWLEMVHPRDRDRFAAHARKVSRPPPAPRGALAPLMALVYRVRHTDGSTRWLATTTATARRSRGVGARVFGTVADVTERVRQRMALRSAERLHRDVWESIPASAAVLDRSGDIVEVNRAWAAVTRRAGGPADSYVGANYLLIARGAGSNGEAMGPRAAEGVAAVLSGAARQFTLDYSCVVPGDDVERWFRMRVLPLHRPARGAIVMHDDITDRMAAEWTTQQHREDLTHMQRLATLGELATSIAHELNQPLSAIMAAASTARRILRDRSDSDMLKAIVNDVLEAVARAADVVRRARAMVRRDDAILEPVSINDVVTGVVRLIGSDVVIHQVGLTLDLDSTIGAIIGDRVQLQQVLLNLLLNAIDALAELPRERRLVVVTTRRVGTKDVEICVRDTGPGIPPDLGNRVFEPFVTSKRKGTGLGLAIVRAIVQSHGGEVFAETPVEGGAVFRVVLPVP